MSEATHTNKLSYLFSLVRRSLRGDDYDYTQGSVRVAIILLAIPMILELSLESVFAVVDMFFVGKLGENAIATVGLTESVITIVYSLAIGLSTAATAIVARRVGEKNFSGAGHAGMQALILSLICTVVISIAGVIFAPDILQLMGASAEVVRDGTVFARIMLGGSVVIILLFLINGIFRGAGNAAIAMRSLWLASLMNIILCPLLIYGWGPFPELGLKGAAIATTIGRGAGVCYQLYYLFRKKSTIPMRREHFTIDWPLMRTMIGVAWPATFQFLIASGSWIVLTRLVAETGGTEASAGYQVAIRNVVFFILPAWGLSNAAATLVGQNLGARQPERAERSVMLTAKYNAIFMAGVMLLFVCFAGPIISVFTSDPAVHEIGTMALSIIGSGYIFYGIGMVMIQALNGAGDTRTPTLINFIGFWLFQIPLAYLLVKGFNMNVTGVFIAIPVAETAIAIASWLIFKKGKWKEVKV
ncbi:MAG TPA: MATE family efflux transporter [Chitinophagaceae bacterium]|nr:MATE family efflux transporter [Chitinophagaceae bacterium]